VLVAALEFEHVGVLALGDSDLYLEIHSLVLSEGWLELKVA
jgi:hypothetical protein